MFYCCGTKDVFDWEHDLAESALEPVLCPPSQANHCDSLMGTMTPTCITVLESGSVSYCMQTYFVTLWNPTKIT